MSGDFDDMDCIYKKRDLISYILSVGEARQLLKELYQMEIFENLSKHDPFWNSEESPDEDRLHDVRMKLQLIFEKIFEIVEKLD